MDADLQLSRTSSIRVRSSVSYREVCLKIGALVYLSLYDDEIDSRVATLTKRVRSPQTHFGELAPYLELTDVAILTTCDQIVHVMRGSSATVPLYRQRNSSILRLDTRLILKDDDCLSASGLMANVATICLAGTFEPVWTTDTPMVRWVRCRRGTITSIEPDGRVSEKIIAHDLLPHERRSSRDTIARKLWLAFQDYGSIQRRSSVPSIVELSGGFDSTLSASLARASNNLRNGVSFEFTEYEFRFEAPAQQAAAKHLGLQRTALSGAAVMPFSKWSSSPPGFDEPNAFVTGIAHAEQVSRLARNVGARKVYSGHGGDHIFTVDLMSTESLSRLLNNDAFTCRGWHVFKRTHKKMQADCWRQRMTGWFVYDGIKDPWIKEVLGVTMRTAFSDLAIFKAGLLWAQWSRDNAVQPNKSILAEALGEHIPEEVRSRPGKAPYDGVWLRSYAVNADHIIECFEQSSLLLEAVGFKVKWLQRRVLELAALRDLSQLEVVAAYSLAVWFIARDFSRLPINLVA